jgi:hypothetical protein
MDPNPAYVARGEEQIRWMLSEIRSCLDAGLFHVVLFPALALPDICGAIQAQNGQATGGTYARWFDAYVAPRYMSDSGQCILTGETCYQLRCAMLHQGRVTNKKMGYDAIMFLRPTERTVRHKDIVNKQLHLAFEQFCTDVIDGVERWLASVGTDPVVRRNLAAKVRIRLIMAVGQPEPKPQSPPRR